MRIAVIGGVGSGKSEVLNVARAMDIVCLSADEINAEMLTDSSYIKKIAEAFPNAVKDGKVDKVELATEIFRSHAKRQKLNSIAHPEIMKRIKANFADTIVVELPLVLESGAKAYFDEIVLVETPLATRLKRLKERGMTYRRAIAVIHSQASRAELKKIATYIIDNSGSIDDLRLQSQMLFETFCK
ncbi:MAG: dephospho-CoA kinase [Clostridia bacterium]